MAAPAASEPEPAAKGSRQWQEREQNQHSVIAELAAVGAASELALVGELAPVPVVVDLAVVVAVAKCNGEPDGAAEPPP
jgi:hypothetical protein